MLSPIVPVIRQERRALCGRHILHVWQLHIYRLCRVLCLIFHLVKVNHVTALLRHRLHTRMLLVRQDEIPFRCTLQCEILHHRAAHINLPSWTNFLNARHRLLHRNLLHTPLHTPLDEHCTHNAHHHNGCTHSHDPTSPFHICPIACIQRFPHSSFLRTITSTFFIPIPRTIASNTTLALFSISRFTIAEKSSLITAL